MRGEKARQQGKTEERNGQDGTGKHRKEGSGRQHSPGNGREVWLGDSHSSKEAEAQPMLFNVSSEFATTSQQRKQECALQGSSAQKVRLL